MFQHNEEDDIGEERAPVVLVDTISKRLAQLPDSYTTVQPGFLPNKEPPVPPLQGTLLGSYPEMQTAFTTEYKWLDNVRDRLNQEISRLRTRYLKNFRSTAGHGFQITK